MARTSLTLREGALIGASVVVAVILAVEFRAPLDALDDQMTSLQYRVRGDRPADSNVVVVYIDQEAIKSLGWPVRRNFYALMLKAMSDLHAGGIGIEAVFEDPKLDYPEYDDLLSRMIAGAGNVVLTCYFDSVAAPGASTRNDTLPFPLFEFPAVLYDTPPGLRVHLPLASLRGGAAGVGQVNITGNADIDLFIGNGRARVPAFALELLRVATRTDRNAVAADGRKVTFRRETGSLSFTPTYEGRVGINFPGGVSSFTSYPFLEVLRAYDALRADRLPSIPVASLRGKIVLVGVIAEGRSQFFRTPVDPRFPAIGLHAAFIDNALHDRFLGATGYGITLLVCLVAGIASGLAALSLPLRGILLACVPFLLVAISFISFIAGGIVFPVAGPVAVGIASGVAGLFLRHSRARAEVGTLESEKRTILERLRDREAKVAMLERELTHMETSRGNDRTGELLEEMRRYKAEIRTLASQADDMDAYEANPGAIVRAAGEFEGIVYDASGPLKQVVEFVGKIAASEAPVLILGESGTGKELIARAIHRRSARAKGVFVAVNCGALSESLLESELFGHERGAFTGAMKEKPGRFELASGGTIFLDEIGEVSESFQVKLLRVLQEKEFERVGGTKTLRTDVRVLAATNRDLKELVRQKSFREDLYYRLNVLTVVLPSLRERQSDIPLLIDHFLRREGGGVRVSRNVMDALQGFTWPGNIRELESAIKRGALLAKAEHRAMMTVKDLSEEIATSARGAIPVEEQVLESLRDKGFSRSSVTETADELGGLNRGTVAEYLRGECLKAFAECTFDLDRAVRRISLSVDAGVNERVRKKFVDYLANLAEAVVPSQPWEAGRAALRPKAKNLPQKYHLYLEQVGEAYYRGVWKVPSA